MNAAVLGAAKANQQPVAERIAQSIRDGLAAFATEEAVRASRFKLAPDCLKDLRLDERVLRVVDFIVAAERTCPKPAEHLGQKCGHRVEFSMTECSSVMCAPAFRNTSMIPASPAGSIEAGILEFLLFNAKRILAADEIATDAMRQP